MRIRRISDAQIAYVIEVTSKRREAFHRVMTEFPTNAKLAEQLCCCQRVIDRIVAGEYGPRETSSRTTKS